ncbi:hypothetical protein AGLY_008892 [Aphis glycines]|uniref:Uncharacterized protein n=1 Tax=Aphis glycines TaxID=307491 RepID=A0A6G0TJD9_APHGL|nr:hypothetical protein AGLY_008892 [Aphis glycines]
MYIGLNRLRACVNSGRSVDAAGYIFAQCAVPVEINARKSQSIVFCQHVNKIAKSDINVILPLIKITTLFFVVACVIPNACHGSTEPCTNNTRLSLMFKSPNIVLVLSAASDKSSDLLESYDQTHDHLDWMFDKIQTLYKFDMSILRIYLTKTIQLNYCKIARNQKFGRMCLRFTVSSSRLLRSCPCVFVNLHEIYSHTFSCYGVGFMYQKFFFKTHIVAITFIAL